MPQIDDALGQALRPRRAHVVFDQHLKQRGPRQARDHPRGQQPQRQAWEHERAQALRSRRREPRKPERKHEDQQKAEPEERKRHPRVGKHPAEPVDPRALFERGHHAGGHPDDHGEEDAAQAERQRRAQAVEDQVEDGCAQPDRGSQIGRDRAPQEPAVLHVERVVQPHLLAQLLLPLRRDRTALGAGEHQLHGIAGEGVHDREDGYRHQEQHDPKLGHASGEVVGEHGVSGGLSRGGGGFPAGNYRVEWLGARIAHLVRDGPFGAATGECGMGRR